MITTNRDSVTIIQKQHTGMISSVWAYHLLIIDSRLAGHNICCSKILVEIMLIIAYILGVFLQCYTYYF